METAFKENKTLVPFELDSILENLNKCTGRNYDIKFMRDLISKYETERSGSRTVISIDGTKECMLLLGIVCTQKILAADVSYPDGTDLSDVVICPVLLKVGNTIRITSLKGYRE